MKIVADLTWEEDYEDQYDTLETSADIGTEDMLNFMFNTLYYLYPCISKWLSIDYTITWDNGEIENLSYIANAGFDDEKLENELTAKKLEKLYPDLFKELDNILQQKDREAYEIRKKREEAARAAALREAEEEKRLIEVVFPQIKEIAAKNLDKVQAIAEKCRRGTANETLRKFENSLGLNWAGEFYNNIKDFDVALGTQILNYNNTIEICVWSKRINGMHKTLKLYTISTESERIWRESIRQAKTRCSAIHVTLA